MNKEQLDAIKARVQSANKCGDVAVKVYEEDAPALIAEVERLQKRTELYREAFWSAVEYGDLNYRDFLSDEGDDDA